MRILIFALVLWLAWNISDISAAEKWLMSMEDIAAILPHYKELAGATIDPQEMSLEALAAGVEYYNSLIYSGHGTISYFSPRSQEKKLKTIFTFEGRKMRADIKEGLEAGKIQIYNGEIQISIRDGHVVKDDLNSIDPNQDPRSWYQVRGRYYMEDPLENRLRDSHARFVGKEKVDEKLCYIVNESKNPNEPNLLWICPEMGFRVVKSYARTWIDRPIATHRRFKYKKYNQDGEKIWFPQLVEYALIPIDTQGLAIRPLPSGGPNVFMISADFKINLDVSSYFEPRFPSGTLIFDLASKREIPVEQILPDFVERKQK